MKAPLRPCPFCGHEKPIIIENSGRDRKKEYAHYHVCCNSKDCPLGTGLMWRRDKDTAISDWNNRVEGENK